MSWEVSKCRGCCYWWPEYQVCQRYPRHENHGPEDKCGEFRDKSGELQSEIERLRAENEALKQRKGVKR